MSTLDTDHISTSEESSVNKKKRLYPNPDSEFISLRCHACSSTTTAFSHSNAPIFCQKCSLVLATPSGGNIELNENVKIISK